MLLGERDQVSAIVRESTLPIENLVQTLTLGILVLSKHDFAETKYGDGFSNTQLASSDAFTRADVDRFREQANQMLMQFAVMVSTEQQEKSFWGGVSDWAWGFGQAYAGAVAWSVTLLAIALLVRYGGGDLIDIFSNWIKPAAR